MDPDEQIPGTVELPGMPDQAPAADAPPAEDSAPKRGRGRPRKRPETGPAGPADTAPKPRRARTTRPTASGKQVAQTVAGLHQLAGGMLCPAAGMHQTGAALVATADDAGKVWAALAERYPLIGRLFTTGGDGVLFVQLAMLYWPIVQVAMAERATMTAGKLGDAPKMPDPFPGLVHQPGASVNGFATP